MNIWAILARAVERWPDEVAVVEGRVSRTWREVAAGAAGRGQQLIQLGAGPGDRVGYLGRNSAEYIESYYAAAGIGAILVPLNAHLTGAELGAILTDAGARIVIGDPPLLDRLESGDWHGERFSAKGTPVAGHLEPVEVAPSDPAQLYYTSGTTGRPKGVVLTHENVVEHALAATSELDLAEDDVWAHVAPMYHLADAWATFAITWVGGRHVIAPRFDPREVLELLVREGVTITNLVPTMLVRMLAEKAELEYPALRLMLSGGAPIAPATVRAVLEVFGCEYAQTYGMTETSPYLTLGLLQPHHRELSAPEQLAKRARTGRPFETIELQVVDEHDQPVPRDDRSVGEIRVRGVTVSPGYWNQPDQTAAAFRDGWLYTGDLARIDDEGYVDIVDRRKDMVLTGGENVYSIEVEKVLLEHPAVLEAAVFGVPDPVWGEVVQAAVVLQDQVAPADLLGFCRERLAAFKCPRALQVRADLPRTGSGKVTKAALRAEAMGS
jgi:acyl-CoA synthetase (AMP-forming)/AMP-acid ligase II